MKNGQEKTKMFNVPPLYNPSQNRTNKPSPPLLNISEIKRSSNEKIKGIYNPFVTRKRNLDGNCVYEECTCVVKYKCVRQVTIIEDNNTQPKTKVKMFILFKKKKVLLYLIKRLCDSKTLGFWDYEILALLLSSTFVNQQINQKFI